MAMSLIMMVIGCIMIVQTTAIMLGEVVGKREWKQYAVIATLADDAERKQIRSQLWAEWAEDLPIRLVPTLRNLALPWLAFKEQRRRAALIEAYWKLGGE